MNITHEYLTQRLALAEQRIDEATAAVNFWAGQRALLRELLDEKPETQAAEEARIDAANGADTSPDGTPPTT